ncbi:MAG: 4-(cytidine 5'-diphospho)-2-C-methyl-D-erythritol kinase [Deltaproteobacteria bacterium]|nr:4-(cytidine 5'-diphospho)-2-C-methyl-D-erythritol kinase [Deltaproteobacteria bacterium]
MRRKVLAPAKLNIRLKITGRRPDGYHELISIMAPVGLFDRLDLEMTRQSGIRVRCKGFPVPDNEDNLVFRAAEAFFSQTGVAPGLSLKLTKHIPVAAGLGGGSSDAASTLMALNSMFSNPLLPEDLARTASRLGADVPFFLRHRPCIARGIGEILEPIENWPIFWYVIVTPPFGVSTSWVYENLKLELTKGENDSIINIFNKEPLDIGRLLENDLESVTASHFPVINAIKKRLMGAGAEGALMTGSGPSVFGIFRSKNKALGAKRRLNPRPEGSIFVAAGL